MTTETKNTTAEQRRATRIARREALAAKLSRMAETMTELFDAPGAAKALKQAAVELNMMTIDDILAGPWAGEPVAPKTPACPACGYQGQTYQDDPRACPNCHGEGLDDVVPAGAKPVLRWVQFNDDGTPMVDDAMIDRALDGWEQWWNGYPLPSEKTARRYAMRHALVKALGVPCG